MNSPNLAKLNPIFAEQLIIRMSVAKARHAPAPTAYPSIAAITGTGTSLMLK